ncbi:hypothetical protein Dred_1043 [Desulforamulus reducens MI-1]|uniref:Uncharacterized protein n=1 Tax=Desulforamulus reducens (strain ATCC BAA-1160 / DSM 100696 / MI-1) TaxID=349161 RepID=A4J3C5_DESRM|nr:pilus assembly PilX N-terminal domain-containing protein [Desulforamulus reducens]ABO49578.1 hypothetical protein Dred_1043 [Desulforamulus reducens MI-1]
MFIKNQKGIALVSVLIILAITSLLGTTVWYASSQETLSSEQVENRTQAYYYAQSGVEMALSYIKDLCRENKVIPSKKVFYGDLNGALSEERNDSYNIETEILYEAGTFTVKSVGIVRKGQTGAIQAQDDLAYEISRDTVLQMLGAGGGNGGSGGPIALFSNKGILFKGSAEISGNVLTNTVESGHVHFQNNKTGIFNGNLYIGPGANKEKVVTYSGGGEETKNIPNGKIDYLPALRSYPLPAFPNFPEDLTSKDNLVTEPGAISGKVADSNGNGIGDVAIYLSPSIQGSLVKTNVKTTNDPGWKKGHGTWAAYTGEGSGHQEGTVIVTPMKDGYTFDPQFREVTGPMSNVNFLAVPSNATYNTPQINSNQTWYWKIDEDGYYDKISIKGDRTLCIDLKGETRKLRVKNLDIQQGNIVLVGEGRLILYVENDFNLSGSSTINANGESNSLIMYYQGKDSLKFAGDTRFKGSIYAKNANISIQGSNNIIGNVITGGKYVSVQGDADVYPMILYAPKAELTVTGSGKILGTVVVDDCIVQGDSRITANNPLDTTIFNSLEWGSNGPPSLSVTVEEPSRLTWRGYGQWIKI